MTIVSKGGLQGWKAQQRDQFWRAIVEVFTEMAKGSSFDTVFSEERLNALYISKNNLDPKYVYTALQHAFNDFPPKGTSANLKKVPKKLFDVVIKLLDDHIQNIKMLGGFKEDKRWFWYKKESWKWRLWTIKNKYGWNKDKPYIPLYSKGRLENAVKSTLRAPFFNPTKASSDGKDGWWQLTGMTKDYFYVWWLFKDMKEYEEFASNPHAYPSTRPWSKIYYHELPNKDTAVVLSGGHKNKGSKKGRFLGWLGIAKGSKNFSRAIPMSALGGGELNGKVIALGAARRRFFKGVFGNVDPEALLWRWDAITIGGGTPPVPPPVTDDWPRFSGRVINYYKAHADVSLIEFQKFIVNNHLSNSEADFEKLIALTHKITAVIAKELFDSTSDIGVDTPEISTVLFSNFKTTRTDPSQRSEWGPFDADDKGRFDVQVAMGGDHELFARKTNYKYTSSKLEGQNFKQGTPHELILEGVEGGTNQFPHRVVKLEPKQTSEHNIIFLWSDTNGIKPPKPPPELLVLPINGKSNHNKPFQVNTMGQQGNEVIKQDFVPPLSPVGGGLPISRTVITPHFSVQTAKKTARVPEGVLLFWFAMEAPATIGGSDWIPMTPFTSSQVGVSRRKNVSTLPTVSFKDYIKYHPFFTFTDVVKPLKSNVIYVDFFQPNKTVKGIPIPAVATTSGVKMSALFVKGVTYRLYCVYSITIGMKSTKVLNSDLELIMKLDKPTLLSYGIADVNYYEFKLVNP